MLEWITKYWLEVLFGLITGGIGLLVRHHLKLFKKQREDDKKAMQDELRKEMKADKEQLLQSDIQIQEKFNGDLSALKKGILSIQGRWFRAQCKTLLASDHIITVEEFEELEDDYNAYKGLGGNHTGDALHASVVEKFNRQSLSE